MVSVGPVQAEEQVMFTFDWHSFALLPFEPNPVADVLRLSSTGLCSFNDGAWHGSWFRPRDFGEAPVEIIAKFSVDYHRYNPRTFYIRRLNTSNVYFVLKRDHSAVAVLRST